MIYRLSKLAQSTLPQSTLPPTPLPIVIYLLLGGLLPLDNNPDHWGTNPGHRDRFIVFRDNGTIFGTSGQIFGTSGQILGPSGQILGPSGQFLGPSGQILGTIGTNLKKFTRSSRRSKQENVSLSRRNIISLVCLQRTHNVTAHWSGLLSINIIISQNIWNG